jgi:hypothetical protein
MYIHLPPEYTIFQGDEMNYVDDLSINIIIPQEYEKDFCRLCFKTGKINLYPSKPGIYCSVKADEPSALSSALSRFIIDIRERAKLRALTKEWFPSLSAPRSIAVAEKAAAYMETAYTRQSVCGGEGRHSRMARLLEEYMRSADVLHLEGFICFRLPTYDDCMARALILALSAGEKEKYKPPFKLRPDFSREKQGHYHVVFSHGNIYNILRENTGGKRGYQLVEGGLWENREYILLLTLCALTPERITLHLADGREAPWRRLNAVFGKMYLCRGCEICRPHSR